MIFFYIFLFNVIYLESNKEEFLYICIDMVGGIDFMVGLGKNIKYLILK